MKKLNININRIIQLKKNGKTNDKIAQEFKCTRTSIRNYLKKFMLDYNKYKYFRISRQEINEMIKMKKERKSNKEIAQKLERSIPTVGRYLQKFISDYNKYTNNRIQQKEITKMIVLKRERLSYKKIGKELNYAESTVGKYIKKFMSD